MKNLINLEKKNTISVYIHKDKSKTETNGYKRPKKLTN